MPYVESKEAAYGNLVHSALENYAKFQTLPTDATIEAWAHKFLDPVMTLPQEAEKKVGVTRDWNPSDFFSKEVWGRGKIDWCTVHGTQAFLMDWKTGKVWEDPLELYVQGVLLHALHPELTSIKGCYVWLKEGVHGEVYDIHANLEKTRGWIEETMDKVGQGLFYAKPNALCGWCDLKSCRHWKDRKNK